MDITIYVIIIFVIAFFYFGGTLGKGRLSYQEILTLAQNAGFQGSDAHIATAIALAESGGNPLAYNEEKNARGGTPQFLGSYGLWQIYLKAHPEFSGQNLYDKVVNANAAFDLYSRRNGFTDWATYNNGDYQSYIQV